MLTACSHRLLRSPGTHVEAEEVKQVHALRKNDFFRRLKDPPQLIELNTDQARFSIAGAFIGPCDDLYPQFIERVGVLVRRLAPRVR